MNLDHYVYVESRQKSVDYSTNDLQVIKKKWPRE